MTEHLHATREFYDAFAADYAAHFKDQLDAKPLARALIAVFAELVHDAGPVADIGCGPGLVTAHLDSLGLNVRGVDLSPEMVALARRTYPDLRFDVGSMTDLDLTDSVLGGIVAWYSIIHTPADGLPLVFSEFHRVLAYGGHLLLAFQVGDEPLHVKEPYGHPVSLDFRRLMPGQIAKLLEQAGFAVNAQLVREPDEEERTQQAYVLARKPDKS